MKPDPAINRHLDDLAFPVVDEERRIVGIVDVEMYTTELSDLDRSARNDYLFQLAGVHLTEAQQSAPLIAFRSRFPWLLCNMASGLMVAVVAGVWLGQVSVVLCTLGAIAGGVASAAVIGMAIPNLLHRLALDPQIAAGPIALAAADVVTLLIYFNLARWLLA